MIKLLQTLVNSVERFIIVEPTKILYNESIG